MAQLKVLSQVKVLSKVEVLTFLFISQVLVQVMGYFKEEEVHFQLFRIQEVKDDLDQVLKSHSYLDYFHIEPLKMFHLLSMILDFHYLPDCFQVLAEVVHFEELIMEQAMEQVTELVKELAKELAQELMEVKVLDCRMMKEVKDQLLILIQQIL